MSVSVVGVVGAGFMGSGIGEAVASAGRQVLLFEPDEAPLARSRERLAGSLATAVSRGKLTEEQARDLTGRITYTTELADLAGVDGVIEAVTENRELKRALFASLDEQLTDARFLASNTSSIPIAELASATRRPERVIGLHFFSPVPVMKLVEIVVGLDTDEDTVAVAETFAAEINKHAIRTKDRSGFVVNALLVPYLISAVRMYDEGFASPQDIDEGMRLGCGHPMGPLTLSDFVGLDVLLAVSESLYEEFRRSELAPPPLLRRMVQAGHLGRKSGRGFYQYAPEPGGDRRPAGVSSS